MHQVIAIGAAVLDILFRQGQPVAAALGGSCFNSNISTGQGGLDCTTEACRNTSNAISREPATSLTTE